MRTVFAISSAIALFSTSAFASKNANFSPVNFVDEVAAAPAPASLTNDFVTFRWQGEEAIVQESFDLTVENTARIQVTDFKNRGDMFEVFDNGQSLGLTNEVDALKDEEVFAATPEEALNDDRFSKGIFDLAKGEHKITIKAKGPYEAGTAAIRVMDHANVAFHKKGKDHDGDDEHDYEEEGGWNKGGRFRVEGHDSWANKRPTNEEYDLSHTITLTKTKWIHQRPTQNPSMETIGGW